MLVVLYASRPAERMRAAAAPVEGPSACKQEGGAASGDALLRTGRECGERATVGSSSASQTVFAPVNVTLTNDVISRNVPRAP
eukprot:3460805-Pleurochrysis_carterae.AAC.1